MKQDNKALMAVNPHTPPVKGTPMSDKKAGTALAKSDKKPPKPKAKNPFDFTAGKKTVMDGLGDLGHFVAGAGAVELVSANLVPNVVKDALNGWGSPLAKVVIGTVAGGVAAAFGFKKIGASLLLGGAGLGASEALTEKVGPWLTAIGKARTVQASTATGAGEVPARTRTNGSGVGETLVPGKALRPRDLGETINVLKNRRRTRAAWESFDS